MPENWEYDQKGWTVFTKENEEIVYLTPDKTGGFEGLSRPGQTFYFSRTLTEKLDSPTLRLETANHNLSVFLNDKLIYTDCPEQDNRIGHLTLPMLKQDRTEPVVLSLPANYQNKTLTIAQSTDADGQETTPYTVWPCAVTLYCGYAYESTLISESFQIAIPAALCFGIGIFLLTVFSWQTLHGKTDIGLLLLALITFLWMTYHIVLSSFTHHYFGILPIDIASLSKSLSLSVLLAFFSSRLDGKQQIVLWILTSLQTITTLISAELQIKQTFSPFWEFISQWIALIALLYILICSCWKWRKHNRFFYLFCPLVWIEILLCCVCIFSSQSLFQNIKQQFLLGAVEYFLYHLMELMTVAALLTAIMILIEQELARRTELHLLEKRCELAQNSFEHLRRHNKEVMILRHDMIKHLTFLRQSTTDEKTAVYLDELIGEQKKIRSVIKTQNQTLDIILNAKLSETYHCGIHIEFIRTQVPKNLPLSDVEQCALFMNILDNAISAAKASSVANPYIRLDMHLKNNFFVFVCENSATQNWIEQKAKKETVPKHGLGLKIIQQIMKRHGNLIKIEHDSDFYRITLAILLN